LGQLGIGRLGMSKGKLLPSLIPKLHKLYPNGIVDIAAGANFTVTVTNDGKVFSFGHSEYNQHGTGNRSNNDYTDPYFYYTPQEVDFSNNESSIKNNKVKMKKVSCGAVYTIGIDEKGNLLTMLNNAKDANNNYIVNREIQYEIVFKVSLIQKSSPYIA
jgi:alpha-tubulin suppressor-like RCC1 family protein